MAPAAITEDYYMILEVDQTVKTEQITKSYRRLARVVHPDKNSKWDATEAFQRLARAYETLKDDIKRRQYDLIYPSLKGKSGPSQHAREQNSSVPNSTESETAQIAALYKAKQERAAQWRAKKQVLDASMFEAERAVRRLEQEIKGLASILAAELAEEAQKNSWSTWILSPIFKKVEESKEVKAQKDRARQERRIEKDMKERRLEGKKTGLNTLKASLKGSQAVNDAANQREDAMTQELHNSIWRKERWERLEKERVERERMAQELRRQEQQREKREREAAESRRRQQEAMNLARQQREEDEARKWREKIEKMAELREELEKQQAHFTFSNFAGGRTPQNVSATCGHGGWWPKLQGRAACPGCHDVWTYLLECPGCAMKACPKCQAAIRRKRRNAARTDRTAHPHYTAPSPNIFDDYDWF